MTAVLRRGLVLTNADVPRPGSARDPMIAFTRWNDSVRLCSANADSRSDVRLVTYRTRGLQGNQVGGCLRRSHHVAISDL